MIMKKISLIIFFILSFSIIANSWEKIPISDYVNKKTKSPWNFYEDFEDQKVGKVNLRKFDINDKGAGKKPFKIKEDTSGNKFLEITVKHGWNNDSYKRAGKETERSEFEVKRRRAINKEIWIGFKMKLPRDFIHIDTRVLFFQFKNNFDPMSASPLLGIRFYEKGNSLHIGGATGGLSKKDSSGDEYLKHSYRIVYQKKNNIWYAHREKRLNQKTKLFNYKLSSISNFKSNELEKWDNYKIGIFNTRNENGFVKVFYNDKLILDYNGVTFNWKGKYEGSHIRIGLYRNSGKRIGIEYPPQVIHFDDFIVVSDKQTLDKYLN